MFKFFIVSFLVFVFFILVFGFSVLRFLFQGLLGRPIQKKQQRTSESGKNTRSQQQAESTAKQRKIIMRDEGEYVDYVEVKE